MPKILVLFYSRTGNTAALADAIADGARSVRFSEVDVRRVDDLAPPSVIESVPDWKASRETLAAKYRTFSDVNELVNYDALVLGTPTRYGIMTAELKHLLDQTGPLWRKGLLMNKVGAAFTSTSTTHGGHETTLWSIMTPMANLGMILVPPGYTDRSCSPGAARTARRPRRVPAHRAPPISPPRGTKGNAWRRSPAGSRTHARTTTEWPNA
jgi:NAD(P)H dehydrogenase (quinone)